MSDSDPLAHLREYRQLAPWNLRDLAATACAMLEATAVRPINTAAAALPSERTIRFYVARNLVPPPEGRGTAATYSYRHLLQVLAIKLRQMEGATLSSIVEELSHMTGDVLERRVASLLGPALPSPEQLHASGEGPTRGRAGQVLRSPDRKSPIAPHPSATVWHRLGVADGVELHLRGDHPAAEEQMGKQILEAVRLALRDVTPQSSRRSERSLDH